MKRKKVNGMFPYPVRIGGRQLYMFEANSRLSLKRVLDIEKRFGDDELVFFTREDPEICTRFWPLDAANAYEVGGRKARPLLFLSSDGRFFSTNIELPKEPDRHGKRWKYLVIDSEIKVEVL